MKRWQAGEKTASTPMQSSSGPLLPAGQRRAPVIPRRRGWSMLVRIVRVLALVATVWLVAVLTAMVLYRALDPPYTSLTAAARLSGAPVRQDWVRLEQISPHLVRAVIASEDAHFCRHRGVSLGEIEDAIANTRQGVPRGASTISMQLTKNLFLWPQRSYIRKAIEIPLTLAMEQVLNKRRILEIYLNVAEWGPGIYGAEAAANYHFRKPASRLSEQEAALLAVSLPSPLARNPGRPGPGLQRLAANVLTRMRSLPRATACLGS